MSKITINVVEPGGSTPVAPNTGLFMNDIGTPEAIAIISAVIILGIIAAFAYKKFKKSDKTSKLAHIIEQIKSTRSNKKARRYWYCCYLSPDIRLYFYRLFAKC